MSPAALAPAEKPADKISVSRVITKQELCLLEKIPQPCGVVIFGASGDLAHRKLFPALLELVKEKLMPSSYYILGVARTAMSDDAFREGVAKSLGGDAAAAKDFLGRCHYLAGDYGQPKTYSDLSDTLKTLDGQYKTGPRHVLYLSTPPALYESISQQLGAAKLSDPGQGDDAWTRIVIEKPFGYSQATAEHLNNELHKSFKENQIYRIDHYLGKETVQNILMFRFANAIYEPVWNQKYIDHIQITAAESDGVEHRAGYYEGAGALRDMFQNHLLQLLSLVAMEPPCSFDAEAVRDEKTKVVAALAGQGEAVLKDAIRAQYAAGKINGQDVSAYQAEPGVAKNSFTETYAALRLEIDNWRWHGVPFYLRSGKRLEKRYTEIAVQFKHVPTSIFKPLGADEISANVLRFRIQPNEGISLSFEAKHPGPKLCMSSVTMHFDYEEAFGVKPPEAYTRLFLDVMLGDQTLFARHDWLSHSWSFLDPILNDWASKKSNGLATYDSGSWGPAEADALLAREGRQWQK